LTLEMSKYDFEYVFQKKVDFRHDQIWIWVQSLKKNLILSMTKYEFEYDYEIKLDFNNAPQFNSNTKFLVTNISSCRTLTIIC
jgi:hypothetical protein